MEEEMQFVTGGDSSSFSKTPAQTPKGWYDEADDDNNTPPPRRVSAVAKKRSADANAGATSTSTQKKTKAPSSGSRKSVSFAGSPPALGAAAIPVRQKQTRKSKGKAASSRAIPRSYDECEEADKALLDMRDDGKEWKEIRTEWKRLTGEPAAASTLPNRYARLKSNFTVIKEEDNALLIIAKREVEDSFEAQKWSLVQKVLQEKGGDSYPPIVLRRQYKKLMVGAGAQLPEGIDDSDFKIPELGSEDERLGREEDTDINEDAA